MVSKAPPLQGFDARLVWDGGPLHPGQERRVGFAFLYPETEDILREAGHFFLWEGRFIGEATVADNEHLSSSREV